MGGRGAIGAAMLGVRYAGHCADGFPSSKGIAKMDAPAIANDDGE